MKKEKSLKKNSVYLIAFTIVLLVIVGLVFIPKNRPKYVENTGLELSESLLQTVDIMEISNGLYSVTRDCRGYEESFDNQFALKTWAMLAYTSMYDMTNDEKYIPQIQKLELDLIELANGDFVVSSTMGFRIHKIYQMLKGKNVLNYENDILNIVGAAGIIQTIRDSTTVNSVQLFSMRSATASVALQDPDYLSPIPSEKLSVVIPTVMDGVENKMKEKAVEMFTYAEKLSTEQNNRNICWSILAKYEYSIVDSGFREEVKTFFDQNFDKSIFTQDRIYNPVELQPCIEVLQNLHKETGKSDYLKKQDILVDYVIETSFENSCTNEEGSALYVINNRKETYLVDNSYMIFLMNENKDGVFKVIE